MVSQTVVYAINHPKPYCTNHRHCRADQSILDFYISQQHLIGLASSLLAVALLIELSGINSRIV